MEEQETAEDNRFKLLTRRYLAWGLGAIATATLSFVVIWSLITETGCREMASTAVGGLIAVVTGLIGFYFGKRVKEE